ncbi:DUF2795 domain-containing protein [Lujinxingia vulgaris]|uniref:DUF2795 domain-containing protein n=1 Tax=Lujinxingia vulgaris TaxID=2600176 RepID=A0A5C6XA53_9DELT|nr:DUF2795 domain-containing protein [Lujinxingia vulgaris]TXD35633.1 DUF2795 domain-containing protein [Lujinxingia vulgaris]
MTDYRISATPSPTTIARVLRGLRYPVGRNGLLQHATDAYAGELILSALNCMPDRTFVDLDDLLHAYKFERHMPGGLPTPAPGP